MASSIVISCWGPKPFRTIDAWHMERGFKDLESLELQIVWAFKLGKGKDYEGNRGP